MVKGQCINACKKLSFVLCVSIIVSGNFIFKEEEGKVSYEGIRSLVTLFIFLSINKGKKKNNFVGAVHHQQSVFTAWLRGHARKGPASSNLGHAGVREKVLNTLRAKPGNNI